MVGHKTTNQQDAGRQDDKTHDESSTNVGWKFPDGRKSVDENRHRNVEGHSSVERS